ncbi:unnamed protein product [Chrysoparadoxa australica]
MDKFVTKRARASAGPARGQAGPEPDIAGVAKRKKEENEIGPVKRKTRNAFGVKVIATETSPSVSRAYSIINKSTGHIGGNGYNGAIYGELTMVSMQKVVNVLKEKCAFDSTSAFIDVGSGLGKPNLHVAQDPGVEVSYGLELEEVRWHLALHNLRSIVKDTQGDIVGLRRDNTFFAHGDIMSAKTFDPFTHVYMFDLGFPPATLEYCGSMFNASKAPYLISYHNPKLTINDYGFRVELMDQFPLSLTGSGESHMMYLYKRQGVQGPTKVTIKKVDALFQEGVALCRAGQKEKAEPSQGALAQWIDTRFSAYMEGGRSLRSRASRPTFDADIVGGTESEEESDEREQEASDED